jgi:hypothetical protein
MTPAPQLHPSRKRHTFELTIDLTDEAVPIFMKAMGNFLDIISIKECAGHSSESQNGRDGEKVEPSSASSDKVLKDFVKKIELKHGEMVSLMRRNKMKIDDLDNPMQKLAFTFFSEIGEISHEAEVILEELRQTKERERG